MVHLLDRLFSPKSVCVIGASRDPESWGHAILRNLLGGGFRGIISAVNPNADRILGVRCYRSVSEIPESVDLAIIALPSRLVYGAVLECGLKQIPFIVIISAGFGEAGRKELEKSLVMAARSYGSRIIGPNCMGLFDSSSDLVATFTSLVPPKGGISFISQSGAVGTTVLAWAKANGVGFSKFVSVGNESDLALPDFLEYLAADSRTKVIALYIESVRDGRRLIGSLESSTTKKPVVAMKVGITHAGSAAASSHTGAIAAEDLVIEGIFRQFCVIRVRDPDALFQHAFAFSQLPLPAGRSAIVVTTGGGWGVECADALELNGIALPPLPSELYSVADQILPDYWSRRNPIDMVASPAPEDYLAVLASAMGCKEFDMAFLIGFGTIGSIAMPSLTASEMKAANEISKLVWEHKKPLFVVDFLGPANSPASRAFIKSGIPVFQNVRSAAEVASAMVRYNEFKKRKGIRT